MAGVIKMPAAGIPFMKNARGGSLSNLANIQVALEYDPDLIESVWHDTFLDRLRTGNPPREWAGEDDTRVATYLQRRRGLINVSSRQVKEVINHYARQHPRNCVHEWLLPLIWDGRYRIATAFEIYWRAEVSDRQPCGYLQAVSRNFFIGQIARLMQPGCQLDEMVVFESGQGQGKTSALRILGGGWYAASHERVTDKDFYQDLQGKALIEISELSAFSTAQIERVKHAISTPTDRFRGSYDARSTDHPRQCIFAGTTNADEWGNDETGLRRFWPVRCGLVDRVALARDRDQLYAEALAEYRRAPEWWTVPAVSIEVQAERQTTDAWADLVLPWVALLSETRIVDVLTGAIKMKPDQMDKWSQMRIAKILKLAGWTKATIRIGGSTPKVWYPPTSSTTSEVETVETFE